MSTIPFKNIPSNLRVPLFFAELDNSQANSGQQTQQTLIIGQMTSAGTATPNVPILSAGIGDAITKCGAGSMLSNMLAAYRGADNFGTVWLLPLSDASGSTPATGSVAITSAPTANGTLYLYIAGNLITLPVVTTQTTAQIATALAAAINATPNIPVIATATTNTVGMAAVNAGLAGNDIDLQFNFLGTAGGQSFPTGFAATITAFSGGALNPTLTTALANLGNTHAYDFIVLPYTDTTSVSAIETFLNDQTGRWSWDQQLYGHAFTMLRGTVGSLQTYGAAQNNQHVSVLGFYGSPTLNYISAASLVGSVAVSVRADPAVPLQTLPIPAMLAPQQQNQFQITDQNTLLWSGISTFTVAHGGVCQIQNLITTYQDNAYGQADNSYLQVETMFTLMYVLRALASVVTTKYARCKLAANGTRFAPGSSIVTPNIIAADLIAQYGQLEYLGLVQNSQAFAQNLIVQQNATNPNRVDVLYPGTLIDQLRIFALLFQFRLQ